MQLGIVQWFSNISMNENHQESLIKIQDSWVTSLEFLINRSVVRSDNLYFLQFLSNIDAAGLGTDLMTCKYSKKLSCHWSQLLILKYSL